MSMLVLCMRTPSLQSRITTRGSYVEILSMKREVKHWFLKTWSQRHTNMLPIEIYHAIEQAFKDFPSMRAHFWPHTLMRGEANHNGRSVGRPH